MDTNGVKNGPRARGMGVAAPRRLWRRFIQWGHTLGNAVNYGWPSSSTNRRNVDQPATSISALPQRCPNCFSIYSGYLHPSTCLMSNLEVSGTWALFTGKTLTTFETPHQPRYSRSKTTITGSFSSGSCSLMKSHAIGVIFIGNTSDLFRTYNEVQAVCDIKISALHLK